jgi:hypothetical protein
MVTARAEEGDKVLGFEVGADDYVTKPFSTRELIVRVRAVVGRTRPAEADARRYRIKVGDLIVDRRRFEVTVGGRAVGLGPKEFEELVPAVHAARLGGERGEELVRVPSSWRRASRGPPSRPSGAWGIATGSLAGRPRNADVTLPHPDRHVNP